MEVERKEEEKEEEEEEKEARSRRRWVLADRLTRVSRTTRG